MRLLTALALIAILTLSLLSTASAVTVDRMFGDHMVLQREMPVPVWGEGDEGEEITVTFGDQTEKTVVDESGTWQIKLDPLKAGQSGTLTVKGNKTIPFEDVLVGEVWVGSGQSNMAGGAGGYAQRDEVLASMIEKDASPMLRLYQRGEWKLATPEAMRGFSAIHLSFGMPLQQELDIPVGLMYGAVGGTPSGLWLTQFMIDSDPACSAAVEKMEATYKQQLVDWEARTKRAQELGVKLPGKPRAPATPGGLYNRHIKPFIPYAIRGVLWDQGESGTALPGVDQYTTMGALIKGWRNAWGQGEFPFLYVQKMSGGGTAWDYENPVTRMADPFVEIDPNRQIKRSEGRGAYRAHHVRIKDHPNTAIVTASDLGSGVHPSNKSGYGRRACDVALGFCYGQDIAIYGPIYK